MAERSKGKLRPSLPRSSDLTQPQAPPDRTRGRDAKGRFLPGNASGRGRGWKRSIRDLAPPDVKDTEIRALAGDSASLFRARLAELPHQGPAVSMLVAEGSRSAVLSAHLAARAVAIGLDTPAGRSLLDLSVKLGQRAERTSVTALDLATRLRATEDAAAKSPEPWWTTPAAPPVAAEGGVAGGNGAAPEASPAPKFHNDPHEPDPDKAPE